MQIHQTALPEVLLLEPVVHRDPRGHLFESFRLDTAARAGLPEFVQENQSLSGRSTLRGLHYQLERPQAKLVRVVRGSIYDIALDIRRGSPSFGRWVAEILSAENRRQLYIPVGFAHGFLALEDGSEVLYKCSDYYSGAADQRGVLWNDPELAIPWPCAEPVVSPKDVALLPLRPPGLQREREDLPTYQVST